MNLELESRTALVLGAGGGLGGAIAAALAREGAQVVLADVNADALAATTARIDDAERTLSLTWDLADVQSIESQVAAAEERFGGVDILVNNTGGPPPSPVTGQDLEMWDRHFRSMVLSVVALTDRVLPGMRERGWGRIVTSTSSGVVAPIPNLGLSNSLRSTLVGWSKTLAAEVGDSGITANVVVPGRIATARTKFLDEKRAEREGRPVADVSADSASTIPAGRYGTPEEYADVVTFLASARASFVTGSVIRVDGGMIAAI